MAAAAPKCRQYKLSASLFEPRDSAAATNDALFAIIAPQTVESAKTPRQTASDRKWEGNAWISSEQLASNVDKRPRKSTTAVVIRESAAAEPKTYPKPRPADPVPAKDVDQRKRDKDRIPSAMTWAWSEEEDDWKLVPRPRVMEFGMFFAYAPIPVKQMVLLQWLINDNEATDLNADFLRTHLIPRLNRTHPVSLRLLDWLVVDYAREKEVVYKRWFPHIKQFRLVNVNGLYLEWLKLWRRRHYDVFRRRHRIYFTLDEQTYSTTVAQLHFFYMAELYGFLDYAEQNAKEIEEHMQTKLGITSEMKKKAAERGEVYRRRPLVEKCPPKAYISEGDCLLKFKIEDSDSESEGDESEDAEE